MCCTSNRDNPHISMNKIGSKFLVWKQKALVLMVNFFSVLGAFLSGHMWCIGGPRCLGSQTWNSTPAQREGSTAIVAYVPSRQKEM